MAPEAALSRLQANADALAGPVVRRLGSVEYLPVWQAMQDFTATRTKDTPDQLWIIEHPPVFTLGLAGRRDHLLRDIGIPVVKTDRGGQITYHGPGQAVVYLLLDLGRRKLKVRETVHLIEQAVIDLLAGWGIAGQRRDGAPGVYVGEAKIAALGLRVKNGCTYHGVSLNADLDLAPFSAINPCGYEGLAVTRLADLGIHLTAEDAGEKLAAQLLRQLENGTWPNAA